MALQPQNVLQTEPPPLLPSVDCMRVLTNDPTTPIFDRFKEEMSRAGLWERIKVQHDALDPEGGRVGCMRAHINAWKASADSCKHLLIFEDDAKLDHKLLPTWNTHAETFLASQTPYDMLFMGFDLGWGPTIEASTDASNHNMTTWTAPVPNYNCTYTLHNWRSTHAYIISNDAMRAWRNMTTSVGDQPIDFILPGEYDTHRFFTVRPKVAFQRFHRSNVGWAGGQSTEKKGEDTSESEDLTPEEQAAKVLEEADNDVDAKMLHRLPNETDAQFAEKEQRFFEAFVSNQSNSRSMDSENQIWGADDDAAACEAVRWVPMFFNNSFDHSVEADE